MKFVRLIYASLMAADCGKDEINSIVDISRKNNKTMGITGALCCSSNGDFLQCLEGPSDGVNMLYHNIMHDKRHTNITLIAYEEINQRLFSKHEMAYIKAGNINEKTLLKHSPQQAFRPLAMNARQALDFLTDLVG